MSTKSAFIPEIPCEELVRKIMGDGWRNLSRDDIDGAWGIAIVRSILDGLPADVRQISQHLGVNSENLRDAYTRLSINGIFLRNRIRKDAKALNDRETLAWCYYAAYASGALGNVKYFARPKKKYRPAGSGESVGARGKTARS